MITIYRRHMSGCRFTSRRSRACQCPVHAEGTLNGEVIRKSLDVRSWEAAQKIVREWEAGGMKEIPCCKDAMKKMVADMQARGLSEDTVKKAEILRDELVEHFGTLPVSSIDTDSLSTFRAKWKVRPSTARKKLERLRSFFKFCIDREWIKKNPAKALKYPKEVSIEKKPYEKEELEKIDWAIPLFPSKGIYGDDNRARIDAFVKVLRWTGLRIRDVVQLKRSQVSGDRITIRTHKNKKPVKLIMHPSLKSGLESVKNQGEYFFWSGLGNPKSCVGDWQRTFRRLSEVAGVHIHAHRWRHTFATDLLSKGVPVSEVAAILGNSTRIVEKHYAQWIESRQTALEEAMKRTWAE
jgi:integrase